MKKEDLRVILIAAFRYSLGRRTYMPGFVIEKITENKTLFRKEDLENFIKDIERTPSLGDDWDAKRWRDFASFCKEIIKK